MPSADSRDAGRLAQGTRLSSPLDFPISLTEFPPESSARSLGVVELG